MKYVIYNIKHKELTLVYVGSTRDLTKRINVHNNDYLKYPESKVYKTIKDNGGWEAFTFNVLEEIDCDCKTDALMIEEKYRSDTANMNTNRCFLTEDERKSATKISKQLYYQKNKETIKSILREYNQERYVERKELGLTKLIQSNYYQKNKDKVIAKSKARYYDKKDEVLKKCKARYHNDIEKSREKQRAYYHKRKAKKVETCIKQDATSQDATSQDATSQDATSQDATQDANSHDNVKVIDNLTTPL